MSTPHTAANCRWAVPTLFMAAPIWADASDRPWTCLREHTPRELESTDVCRTCANWTSRVAAEAAPQATDTPRYFLDILAN